MNQCSCRPTSTRSPHGNNTVICTARIRPKGRGGRGRGGPEAHSKHYIMDDKVGGGRPEPNRDDGIRPDARKMASIPTFQPIPACALHHGGRGRPSGAQRGTGSSWGGRNRRSYLRSTWRLSPRVKLAAEDIDLLRPPPPQLSMLTRLG